MAGNSLPYGLSDQRCISVFRQRFAQEPDVVASAPGRVNLIGEHTDYNDGFVLPMAIDRRATVAVGRAAGPHSTFWAADLPEDQSNPARIDLTAARLPAMTGFERYLAGVAAVMFDRLGAAPVNLDVALSSNVPIGSGLSSSAAIEVAMATALDALLGGTALADPLDKARLCQHAEHRYGGTPCGIMDMLVASSAVEGRALLIDCRSGECETVPLPPAREAVILVADTGVARALASGAYAERRAVCEQAAARLGVAALRDATMQMLADADLSEAERRCATHVVEENQRTLLAAAALRRADLDSAGALMHESHRSLRDLYRVSCPELDCLVDAAEERRGERGGVFGSRMTGAGFGGCAIVMCATAAAAPLTAHLAARFQVAFGRAPAIFPVRAAGAAGVERD